MRPRSPRRWSAPESFPISPSACVLESRSADVAARLVGQQVGPRQAVVDAEEAAAGRGHRPPPLLKAFSRCGLSIETLPHPGSLQESQRKVHIPTTVFWTAAAAQNVVDEKEPYRDFRKGAVQGRAGVLDHGCRVCWNCGPRIGPGPPNIARLQRSLNAVSDYR
jgi:hypothetical protein